MSEAPTAFNGSVAETFARHAETVRGQLRYELVKRNLGRFVAANSLRIADIGGGAAIDTVWLASLGHCVTIADPAADQLAKARARLIKESSAIRRRVSLVEGTSGTLLEMERAAYDLVLSHGVAMYLPEPQGFIAELAALVRPGGHVSLLEKGYYGAQQAMVREGKYGAARELADTHKFINHMGREAWAFLPEEIDGYLQNADCLTVCWAGVRINRDADYRPVAEVDPTELRTIIEDEYELGHRPDTRGLGQMLHFVAQKSS